MPSRLLLPTCAALVLGLLPASAAEPLPGTKPLTAAGDLAAQMVAGMHTYLDRATTASVAGRKQFWKPDFSATDAFRKSVEPNREHLRKLLGLADRRVPPRLEYAGGPADPPLVAEAKGFKVYAVRWAVLPGVDAEGLLLEPDRKPGRLAVVIPDADWTPEMVCGLAAGAPLRVQFAPEMAAQQGYRVLIPTLIDRSDTHAANPRLNRATNQPHREFVHRMAFEMGRTLPGYEVQKVLAGLDWLTAESPPKAREWVAVVGFGEGGLVARLAAAVDERINYVEPHGQGGPAEGMAEEPIYRNLWGFLREFGTAELELLIAPRVKMAEPQTVDVNGKDVMRADLGWPVAAGPPAARPGRAGAAPGRLTIPDVAAANAESGRGFDLARGRGRGEDANGYVLALTMPGPNHEPVKYEKIHRLPDVAARQKRQFDQLVSYTQKLWRDSEAVRKEFWKKADASSPAAWEKSCDWYRDYFHSEVIGKLPEPTIPLNPRTRQVYEEKTWTGYEVMLDVYPDVFAYGILLLPKDLKPGERRPVVVCQHGLEGTPRHTIDVEKRPVYNHFSRRLVEQGYIVYAPQNPYYGENTFRQLQRKANPLKLSLFSFIIRQHQRTLDWLETLPNVDPKRIAFYGLSYGGKTAMRVPAVEKRYCLSICSGDFNEWIGKNVSVDLDRSYMWTREYEMYEFDLGNTFNYAEMAYLIAPRPFMVERGHDDGVGIDEMVAYEYARVRYLYANRLKIADRTEIEFFPGGHMNNCKGTFAFLAKHLKWEPR